MEPEIIAKVVEGDSRRLPGGGMCSAGRRNGPDAGVLLHGEYDLAGFVVGLVDQSHLLDGQRIRPGDAILGLASTGLHTNVIPWHGSCCSRWAVMR